MAKRLGRAGQPIEARISDALSQVAVMLRLEDVVIELVEFERRTGVAVLRLHGDCPHCEMPVSALRDGIEAQLKMRVPEVRGVRSLDTDPS